MSRHWYLTLYLLEWELIGSAEWNSEIMDEKTWEKCNFMIREIYWSYYMSY